MSSRVPGLSRKLPMKFTANRTVLQCATFVAAGLAISGCLPIATPAVEAIFEPDPGHAFDTREGAVSIDALQTANAVCYTTDGSTPAYNNGTCAGGTTQKLAATSITLSCNDSDSSAMTSRTIKLAYGWKDTANATTFTEKAAQADFTLNCKAPAPVTIEQPVSTTCWGVDKLPSLHHGQTFTATQSGWLTRLDMALQLNEPDELNPDASKGKLVIAVFEGAGFSGRELHRQQVLPIHGLGSVTPMEAFLLTAAIPVVEGQTYTIGVAKTGDTAAGFCGTLTDAYAAGATYFNGNPYAGADATFRATIERSAVNEVSQPLSTTCWGIDKLPYLHHGQSFTATRNGLLSRVDMALQLNDPDDYFPDAEKGNVVLAIFDGAGFSGTELHRQNVLPIHGVGSVTPMQPFLLTADIPVVAGHTYTIGLAKTGDTAGGFCGTLANAYTGGSTFFNGNAYDAAEATFRAVIVPAAAQAAIDQPMSTTCWGLDKLPSLHHGQSFTADRSGLLTRLDLALQLNDPDVLFPDANKGNVVLAVFDGAGFSGTELHRQQVLPIQGSGAVTAMEPFLLTANIPVTEGHTYTVGLARTGDTSGGFCGTLGDVYSAGSAYFNGNAYTPAETTFRALIQQ